MRHISSFENIGYSQSSRRHRIGRGHVRHVIFHTDPEIAEATETSREEWLWIGTDSRGVVLEVVGVVHPPNTMIIIHVMPHSFRRSR